MLAAIIFAHDLGTIVLPGRPSRDLDSFRIRFQLAEPFHEGTPDDGSPAVWRLHDFDGRVNSRTDGFAKVRVLAETTDQEDSLDFLLCGGDLASD